jgi:Zn-dependent protease with chaperone function
MAPGSPRSRQRLACRLARPPDKRKGATHVAQFSNPELPEEVNNSDEKPLRSFLAMAGSIALLGILVALGFAFLGGLAARYVPYSVEAGLIEPYSKRYPQRVHAVENYLQGIADRLIEGGDARQRMALPGGMAIRVHYVNEPVVNAFATLGGNLAVYRGLLERVPDENTLAMVLAHEIAHAQHRHPIAGLGRSVAFAAVVSLFSAAAGGSVIESTFGGAGMLTLLTFSRAQEEEADDTGVAALARAYGHAGGAIETFGVLRTAAAEKGRTEPPKFLSTHPVTEERVARLAATIKKNGWNNDGVRIAIPEAVRSAIEKDVKEKPKGDDQGSGGRGKEAK